MNYLALAIRIPWRHAACLALGSVAVGTLVAYIIIIVYASNGKHGLYFPRDLYFDPSRSVLWSDCLQNNVRAIKVYSPNESAILMQEHPLLNNLADGSVTSYASTYPPPGTYFFADEELTVNIRRLQGGHATAIKKILDAYRARGEHPVELELFTVGYPARAAIYSRVVLTKNYNRNL